MLQKGTADVLEEINRLPKKDRVEALRQNNTFVIRTVIQGALDPRIVWLLPEGEPPYTESKLVDQEGVLVYEARKLVYFVQGGHATLKQTRRETMFLELLEACAPKDAKLLCAIKDKKWPYKNITKAVVAEAFPGLIPDGQPEA